MCERWNGFCLMTEHRVEISTRDLRKSFGHIQAVKPLNLNVERGTTFGYLGPNGAGKTTTVRMLSGLLRPTEGSATVCGFDISNQRNQIKATTGLLPEAPGLYSKLSAYEFLEFIGGLYDLSGEALARRINRLLKLLDLTERQNDLLESYSSGMKQKVLVASTLIHEPRLVFLDEPTARLDPAASALVKEIINALAEETNTTFFICTHLTDFAEDVCDVIGILVEGELVEHGPPQDIINRTDSEDLENAYLKIVGGKIDREELLSWRE